MILTSCFFGGSFLYLIYVVGLLQRNSIGIASGIEVSFFLTGSSILVGANHGLKKVSNCLFWATLCTGFFLFGNIMFLFSDFRSFGTILTLILLLTLFTRQIPIYRSLKWHDTSNWGEKRHFIKSFPLYAYVVVVSYIALYVGGIYLLFQQMFSS